MPNNLHFWPVVVMVNGMVHHNLSNMKDLVRRQFPVSFYSNPLAGSTFSEPSHQPILVTIQVSAEVRPLLNRLISDYFLAKGPPGNVKMPATYTSVGGGGVQGEKTSGHAPHVHFHRFSTAKTSIHPWAGGTNDWLSGSSSSCMTMKAVSTSDSDYQSATHKQNMRKVTTARKQQLIIPFLSGRLPTTRMDNHS